MVSTADISPALQSGSAMIAAVERENLSAKAYSAIRHGLMTGIFKPGQKLLLRPLADNLGISVTPVREALFQLVSEHALSTDTARSVKVPILARERYTEIRDLRILLEGRAAAAAAALITRKEIEHLEELHRSLIEAKTRGDVRTTLILNERFHLGVYRAAHMPVLSRILESLWVQVGPTLNRAYEDRVYHNVVKDAKEHPHLRVLRALRRRNAEQATRAIGNDIMSVSQLLEAKLPAAAAEG